MSRSRRNFSAEFKTNLVLQLLKGEKELNALAVENDIQPNLLRNWKKEFLANVSPKYFLSIILDNTLLTSLTMHSVSIFPWCHLVSILKYTVKCTLTFKACIKTYISYRLISVLQS